MAFILEILSRFCCGHRARFDEADFYAPGDPRLCGKHSLAPLERAAGRRDSLPITRQRMQSGAAPAYSPSVTVSCSSVTVLSSGSSVSVSSRSVTCSYSSSGSLSSLSVGNSTFY